MCQPIWKAFATGKGPRGMLGRKPAVYLVSRKSDDDQPPSPRIHGQPYYEVAGVSDTTEFVPGETIPDTLGALEYLLQFYETHIDGRKLTRIQVYPGGRIEKEFE